MSLFGKLAVVVIATGCVASTPDGAAGGSGGKGDGVDEACTQQYVEWMLSDYKAAVVGQPLTPARITELEALARQAPCRGEALGATAFTTWLDVTSLTTYAPYFQQHADATIGFLMNGRPERGDYDAYLRATAVKPATRDSWRVMKAAKPIVTVDRQGMSEWLDIYQANAEELTHPLSDPALYSQVEGYWTLDPGEAGFLDLLAESRPTQFQDGAFAAWIDAYGDILKDGVSIDAEDDFVAGYPRSPARDAFLDRYRALAPTARGPGDHEQWMWELDLWASLAASADDATRADYQGQLDRVDTVRPAELRGAGTYRVWLQAVGDTAATGATPVFEASVMPAKPCVEGDGDAAYATFLAANPALPAEIRTQAAPTTCP